MPSPKNLCVTNGIIAIIKAIMDAVIRQPLGLPTLLLELQD